MRDYSYVFQFKDWWGNVRLSYSDNDLNGSIDPATEIIQEKNYYPFGLTHKGYNNVVQGGNSMAQKYKTYQGQELSEELGYNMLEFKFRHYDAAIGRFMAVDPLADDYVYNSTYAFQENKLGLGTELEGLELDRINEGGGNFFKGISNMIGESLNVSRQMDIRGFSGGERAEEAQMESRQVISNGAGQADQGIVDMAKGSVYFAGEIAEGTGEVVEIFGIATAQPEIAAAGAQMQVFGVIAQGLVDLSDGKDVTETVVDMSISATIGAGGKQTVKAAKKANGGDLNNVSEAIIQGTAKAYELISTEVIVPKVMPVMGPIEGPNN